MESPGLIVAPLTPFSADLAVNEPALKRQIDYVVNDCRATMEVAAGVETQIPTRYPCPTPKCHRPPRPMAHP